MEAVQERVRKAWGAFWGLADVLTDRRLALGSRCRYLTATVGSVLLFGLESVELNTEQLKVIRKTRREMLRIMGGRRYKSGQPSSCSSSESSEAEQENAECYGEWLRGYTRWLEAEMRKTGEAAIWEGAIIQRKVRWAGHIVRRGARRRMARVLAAGGEERRRAARGRPRHRWQDSMVALVGDDWATQALDRPFWREMVQHAHGLAAWKLD